MTSTSDPSSESHPFFGIDPVAKPSLPFSEYFHKGMGTEHVGPFLYSLIRMVRPSRLLEVGMGYTTPWLLQGLMDNESVYIDTNADVEYFRRPYDPRLICIDNFSCQVSSAHKKCRNLRQNKYLQIIEGAFQGRASAICQEYGSLDFVWFDCGGVADYEAFCDEYLAICSGYVFFHFTYFRGKPNRNNQVITDHVNKTPAGSSGSGCDSGWFRMDIVEPRKYRQGSVTMFRRRN